MSYFNVIICLLLCWYRINKSDIDNIVKSGDWLSAAAEFTNGCCRHTGVVPKKCSDKRKFMGGGSFIYGGQEFSLSRLAAVISYTVGTALGTVPCNLGTVPCPQKVDELNFY